MLFACIYDRVGIWITSWKYLHDNIISLRVEVWDNKTSLTPPFFIEMPVLSQENDRAVIYQKVIK
jgi:hypothetical protein